MNKTETKDTTTATTQAPQAANLPAPAQTVQLAVSDNIISKLDELAKQGALAQTMSEQFKQAFIIAQCVQDLRNLLTPQVMKSIMPLQNSPLGFVTDKPEGYKEEVVRDCLIEAIINGVRPVGNEFNILCSRCYITKNGMKHKLKSIPGLYRNITPGLPKSTPDGTGAVVVMSIDWTYNGVQQKKDLALAIRVNRGMGADAIIGKATRKASAWLYEEVTGNSVNEGDASESAPFIEAKPVSAIEEKPEDGNVTAKPIPPAQNLVDGQLPM